MNKNPVILTSTPFLEDRLPTNPGGGKKLRYDKVSSIDLIKLIEVIISVKKYYSDRSFLENVLLTIHYKGITPKTARVSTLFCSKGSNSFKTMVGARYDDYYEGDKVRYRHVVTHYIPPVLMDIAVNMLRNAANLLDAYLGGSFTNADAENKERINSIPFNKKVMSKTLFFSVIKDASEIMGIDVLFPTDIDSKKNIISFFPCFRTGVELEYFLKKIGIKDKVNILDRCTAILNHDQIDYLSQLAPYVICMGRDFSLYEDEEVASDEGIANMLPKVDEKLPVIGVFDSYFDKTCFFSEYVEAIDLLGDRYLPGEKDYYHGTKVDSILVMGHLLNGKEMNDKCGFFRVKHFIVGGFKYIDFEILFRKMEEVVRLNCAEIKVWNFSIGDRRSADPNYISILGAKIDDISRKYNVLFVVSGTNLDSEYKDERIGGPADSLNALVVNSVDFDNSIPSYARKGPALTFIQKPDISYYGGTDKHPLICYSPNPNDCSGAGTSFAAPYIARKCAYLIHKCNVPVQCAKALIIDSAYGWTQNKEKRDYLGYGIPKVDINEIVGSNKDEIKFIFYGSTKNQRTYICNFPLLLENNSRFNYRAKITFCYFTYGCRNYGVDYSEQELTVNVGKAHIKQYKNGKTYEPHCKVDSVAHNDVALEFCDEGARVESQRKWNNTKIFIEPERKRGREYQNNEKWGIMVSHIERDGAISDEEWHNKTDDYSINFGVVVSLKTLDGTDARYDSFFELVNDVKTYVLRKLELNLDNAITIQANKVIKPI